MSAIHRLALSALLLAAGLGAASARAVSADKLYTMLAPSVWRVLALDAQNKPFSQGSGVIIGPEALITNCHVLAKANSIMLIQGDVIVLAKLKYIDLERDLCQLSARGLRAPAVQLGDSDKLAVGQKIYTLGNPINLELTLSDGIISSLRRDSGDRLRYIQISAPISHGSSGGGLFDDDGKLIGITSAIVEAGQNLNLAIPVKWLGELAPRSAAALAKYEGKPAARLPEATAPVPTPIPLPVAPPAAAKPPAPVVVQQAPAPRAPAIAPAYPRTRPAAPAAAVASGYAELADIETLVKLAPNARSAYEDFLKAPLPRAFAVSVTHRSWSSWGRVPRDPTWDPDPSIRVIPLCEAHASAPCVLYAVDNVVVYKPYQKPAAPAPNLP